MTREQYTALVETLTPARRRIYWVIHDHGPITKNELHGILGKRSKSVTFSDFLRPMMETGLVREAGRRSVKRPSGRSVASALFEAVPLNEIERERNNFALNRKSTPTTLGQRVGALRRLEQGDFEDWYRARRRLVELTQLLTRVEAMAFWEAAPPDDRVLVTGDLLELHTWIEKTLEAFDDRYEDDDRREKVRKLREVRGRTAEEAAAFRRKADKLARRLA